MVASVRSSWLLLALVPLLVVACTAPRRVEVPSPAERATSTASGRATAPRAVGFYAADEALRDALSGTLRYVGTSKWPGSNRTQACAFRNERVLVVNVYCTITELQAFRLEIYSPTRGHVRIYAESKGRVSAHTRSEYFTFTAESEPAPSPELRIPALALTMSMAELRAYEQRRYDAYLPACYGGTEFKKKKGGCIGALAPRAKEWNDRNRAFLEQASESWYRVVRELRSLAARYGKEPQ